MLPRVCVCVSGNRLHVYPQTQTAYHLRPVTGDNVLSIVPVASAGSHIDVANLVDLVDLVDLTDVTDVTDLVDLVDFDELIDFDEPFELFGAPNRYQTNEIHPR